jgi:type III pantothenate kinase
MRLPDDEPFGRDTEQAMLQGVVYGAQGLVRRLVERYAMAYDAYPMVVATGGDAGLLFEGDELVDRVVPHLTLRGIAVACQRALAASGDAGGLDWA